MKSALFIICLCCTSMVQAQLLSGELSAYSGFQSGPFSFAFNKAALATQNELSAGIHFEKRFLLEELNHGWMTATFPSASGNFGLSVLYSGSRIHSESSVGLAYARQMGSISAGIQFNYHSYVSSGFENASAVTVDAGLLLQFSEKFKAGFGVNNPLRSAIGKLKAAILPFRCIAGFGYDFSANFFAGIEFVKLEGLSLDVNTGFIYTFYKKLFAFGGITSGSSIFYMGTGILLNDFRIDATGSYHPYLGFTPGLRIIYKSNGRK